MKKIAEGTVSEIAPAASPADAAPSDSDSSLMGIVGCYEIYKSMAMIDGKFGHFTKEEVMADLEKQKAAGELEEHDAAEMMQMFGMRIEFKEDHSVVSWMKIPEGTPEEEIKKAVEAGMITEVKDGYGAMEKTEWKAVNGVYYYDSKSNGEVNGEKVSPWEELKTDEEGLISYAQGMMKLKKI